MKHKIIAILIIALFISSSIGTFASEETSNIDIMEVASKVTFSEKTITSEGEYVSVNIDDADRLMTAAGKPMLPVYTETFTFPLGTKIKNVDCVISSDIQQETISGKINPAPQPIPQIYLKNNENKFIENEIVEDVTVYSSSDLFPEKWYDYSIRCGLDGDENVIFVTVSCYPVRYSPLENTLHTVDSVDIKITYEEPENPAITADEYDLAIIAPRRFAFRLLPLVIHKNRHGMKTMLKTTESIYRQYDGRDKAEKIKYFIEDAVGTKGVEYVLLMGGKKSQGLDWHVPPRFSRLVMWASWPECHLTDLYYSDVYRYNESSQEHEFDDWDSNGNGVFAEWNDSGESKDILDLTPDVYIGRLACRNVIQVGILVRKIIDYETKTYGKEWFKRMLLCGGDTFWNPYSEAYEGEIETNLSGSYMEPLGFEITRLWTSTETLSKDNVTKEFNQGVGYVHFAGHGSPLSWSTHPPQNGSWLDVLLSNEMNQLNGGNKLPVVVVGGCHNSLFSVHTLNFFRGYLKEGPGYFNTTAENFGSFYQYEWIHECWSWAMVRQRNGGSIAVIGNTGFGYGAPGYGCTESTGGYIETRFFYNCANLSQSGQNYLGKAHSQAIADYVIHFDDQMNTHRVDRKTVEQWALLGDPSLKIGGYSS